MKTNKKKSGLFWHVHHDLLVEYCYNYKERYDCIVVNKPKSEIPTRLKLFKLVKGKFPNEVIKACKTCNKACKACNEAYKAYSEAYKAYSEAYKARDEVYKAREEAYKAYNEACKTRDEAINDNLPALLKLHKKECGCGWTPEAGIKF